MSLLLPLLSLLSLSAVQNEPVVAQSRLRNANIAAGYCRGAAASVDISNLLIMENQRIVARNPPRIITINGESLIVQRSEGGPITVYDIDDFISPDEDLDIVLRLASYDGRIVLYWKETYLHRIYRQGVIAFDDRLQSLCEGRAGSESDH